MKRGLVCAAAFALAAAACEPADKMAVVDGEHVIVKGHKITLHQLDAPDKNGACDAEKALGAFAEERLGGLLMAGKEIEFRKTGMACLQFMDCDGFVSVDGKDVGETLIAEGLAVKAVIPESGDAPYDWCGNVPGFKLPGAPAETPADLPPEQTIITPPETPAPN
jgi:endonuclease YncB( thermonuclease family)